MIGGIINLALHLRGYMVYKEFNAPYGIELFILVTISNC